DAKHHAADRDREDHDGTKNPFEHRKILLVTSIEIAQGRQLKSSTRFFRVHAIMVRTARLYWMGPRLFQIPFRGRPRGRPGMRRRRRRRPRLPPLGFSTAMLCRPSFPPRPV